MQKPRGALGRSLRHAFGPSFGSLCLASWLLNLLQVGRQPDTNQPHACCQHCHSAQLGSVVGLLTEAWSHMRLSIKHCAVLSIRPVVLLLCHHIWSITAQPNSQCCGSTAAREVAVLLLMHWTYLPGCCAMHTATGKHVYQTSFASFAAADAEKHG